MNSVVSGERSPLAKIVGGSPVTTRKTSIKKNSTNPGSPGRASVQSKTKQGGVYQADESESSPFKIVRNDTNSTENENTPRRETETSRKTSQNRNKSTKNVPQVEKTKSDPKRPSRQNTEKNVSQGL